MKLKGSLSQILSGITVKSTSGQKYSMSRYRGQKGLFDVTVEALTFRDKTRSYDLGIYKRTQVKRDSEEYSQLCLENVNRQKRQLCHTPSCEDLQLSS